MAAVRGFSLAKISKIRVAFNTFDSRVASARYLDYHMIQFMLILTSTFVLCPNYREFLRRVSASKLQETNPKCQITADLSVKHTEPTVDIEFSEWRKLYPFSLECLMHYFVPCR